MTTLSVRNPIRGSLIKVSRHPGFFPDAAESDYFRLTDSFLRGYMNKKPAFGYSGLGEFVFYRTYSRLKEDNSKETFFDVIKRVVEGTYEIQRRHCHRMHVPWDLSKAQDSASEMFERMWAFKFLPPGRGLWMMGTRFIWERGSACLNNCGFCSTEDITVDPAEPFCFLMDMSMLGVGMGFDTRGANKLSIKAPDRVLQPYVIDDSREGWVGSVRSLVNSYTSEQSLGLLDFDYSQIRKAGMPIKGFGGSASGPDTLAKLHVAIRSCLDSRVGKSMSSVTIVDIMNMIGACVVAGNVRRSAELSLGDPDDGEYSRMKNAVSQLTPAETISFYAVTSELYKKTAALGPDQVAKTNINEFETLLLGLNAERAITRATSLAPIGPESQHLPPIRREVLSEAIETWNSCNSHRWASNNSVLAKVGMDYSKHAANTAANGEPGYVWLENMRDYGRMIDGKKEGIDAGAMGTNPCSEQTLESYELCCLSESFPSRHDDSDDYMRTLKFAYLYPKTVTLLPTHCARTNAVMLRNRRIGLSQTGIVAAFEKFGRRNVLRDFCHEGYTEVRRWDKIYSRWLCVGPSIKVTSVKPSGTVSLVAGVPPGIHYPEAKAYWRHVRVAWNSSLIKVLRDAGYHIETDVRDPSTAVVRFGVDESHLPSTSEISMWEQLLNVVDMQHYWADNSPSATIKFRPHEAPQIESALKIFEDRLKCISFLPHFDHNYAQAPYVPCTPQEVAEYNGRVRSIDFGAWIKEDAVGSKFCDNESCQL